jgi:ATP-dependent exoDNAse (exonuclease V) beta subunit
LDEFLAIINARSAEGLTLADLAHDLRTGLTQPDAAGEEIHHDAIQMMTSHKSKGLEWEAVIVPYLFRRIEWKSAEYPRLVFLGANDAIICRDKAEYQERAQAVVDLRERQQCQRLYYVMCTRAKRTLLLIDDEAAMARQIPNRAGEIAGNFLQFTGGPNREFFHSLPDTLSLAPEKSPLAPAQDIDLPNLPPLTTVEVAQAVASANYFPRRTTPHALAIHTRDEAEPEKQTEREDDQLTGQADGPGILYGIWWHEFVQKIPWNQPATAWSRVFEESQPHSPQPERAALEWDLFRRSPLAQWLAEPGRLIQVELPFLWRNGNDETCLEGVMDLAVYVASESTWYVIDWKTNQPGTSGSGGVVEVYRGQIEAYARALREMLSAEVRGSLYLTRTGEWLPVE